MGQGVKTQRQNATRLAYKACFKGSVESNMEPTLGQNTGMQMQLARHNETPFNVILTSPEKVNFVVFSFLESLKKHKRRLHWGTFFECSLVGSKKG